jgi:hypothetical protein
LRFVVASMVFLRAIGYETRAMFCLRPLCLRPVAALVLLLSAPLWGQQPPPQTSPDGWPRSQTTKAGTFTVYQPQLDSWDGYKLFFHAAASVQAAGVEEATFGVLEFESRTLTDRLARVVELEALRITKATFPSAPALAEGYRAAFQAMVPSKNPVIALDRLESQLAILGAEKTGQHQPVKNEPPRIFFAKTAAALVYIDGEAAWRPVSKTALERVINTRALVLKDTKSGQVVVHLLDGWVGAPGLAGPWAQTKAPSGADKVAGEAAKAGVVDLMEGPEDPKTKKKPSLKNGVPQIIIAFQPTEVVNIEGEANWVPIEGTQLLYIQNTAANVFRDLATQQLYVLISGRWFASSSLEGPWAFVAGDKLPADFARIPSDSPKENVKASVPGTPQAQEAVIAAQIPQTATVYVDKAKFTPTITGTTVLKPIDGTALFYVFNSPDPIILVSETEWYAVQNGVWFTAGRVDGPWTVARAVPPVIYTIPVSAPVHYVTYARIYNVTPTYVVVGYTPGYFGTVITPAGVVVYGTGYVYPAYVGTTVWYGPPVTYGYAVNVTYTPWTGWAFGFMAVGVGVWYAPAPYWGPMPYRGVAYGPNGAVAWGPGGWAATSGNVYSRWGSTTAVTRTSSGYNAWTGNAWSTQAGRSYNSTTGQISAGQRGAVQNVYTGNYATGGRGATYNPTTGVGAAGSKVTVGNAYTGNQATAGRGVVTGPGGQSTSVAGVKGQNGSAVRVGDNYYGTKDGNVYKGNSQGGFEQVTKPSGGMSSAQTQSLQQQQSARQTGEQRATSARASSGSSTARGGASRPTGGRTGGR